MKHDWSEIARSRLVALVEALERMEPDQIEEFRARPGTALVQISREFAEREAERRFRRDLCVDDAEWQHVVDNVQKYLEK